VQLLLITGAGASHNLAIGDQKMPLMTGWSQALAAELDGRQPRLAEACGLTPAAKGPLFEANLGRLLEYARLAPLNDAFINLSGPNPCSYHDATRKDMRAIVERLRVVQEAIDVTLYRSFWLKAADETRAAGAYQELLRVLRNPELVIATTNYDRIAETALELIECPVDNGFTQRGQHTPRMNMIGRFRNRGDGVTLVLHLHGAVGWYEVEGTVEDHAADKDFNSTLGRPVVLYPDPDKDPLSDVIVSQIWHEFDEALAWADHILVLGHSLHDEPLVNRIRNRLTDVERPCALAVTHHENADVQKIADTFGHDATPVYADFGPQPEFAVDALERWAGLE
jgi:hypothetical protein